MLSSLFGPDLDQGFSERVKIRGYAAIEQNCNIGVPQGSVIGLSLFLIYTTDIPFKIRLYSDDYILYRKIDRASD